MRVLVLCEYSSLNGGERSLLEAAGRITTPGIEIAVAAPSSGPLADALHHRGLAHLSFDLSNARGRRHSQSWRREQIADCITRYHAELVHANSVSMSRLAGPVARELGVPSIGHLRDIIRLSRAAIEDLNEHQCLLAVSDATRQWYVAAGLENSKAEVAYNGVDLQRFHARSARGMLHEELDIPASCQLIGNVGQIGMRKGVDLYVDAAARVSHVRDDVHFVHVGQRYSRKEEAIAFEQNVRRAAVQGTLKGRFHFLGVRDDVELILNELAVYVHAARQEPLGRVLLEAGASATPIVATRVGGTTEIFPASSDAALLVPPDSAPALASAILRLLESPGDGLTKAANARHRMIAAFDADSASRELRRWYQRVGIQKR